MRSPWKRKWRELRVGSRRDEGHTDRCYKINKGSMFCMCPFTEEENDS